MTPVATSHLQPVLTADAPRADARSLARPAALTRAGRWSDTRTVAAALSQRSAVGFLVLLAALHVLKPELDPSWRFVSEYAIGTHGWVMVVAFLALALSCAAAAVALRPSVATRGGRVGLALLLAVAVALVVGGAFAMDPVTARPDQLTAHGRVHALSTIGMPLFPVAALLLTRSLTRAPAWGPARPALRWTAHLTWVTLLAMNATIALLLPQHGGRFGPAVWIGWPNRLLVVAYAAWLILAARSARRLRPA